MTDSGPQHPGESEGDYIRRMGRVSREQERIRSEGRMQDRLDAAAYEDRESRLDRDADADLAGFIKEATGGVSIEQLRGLNVRGSEAQAAINAVKKASKGRATKARNRRVKRAVRKHKGGLKSAGKQVKGDGCAVAAVMMLGVFGGAGWAVYETAASLLN